jgi:hypothetical protein
MRNAAIVTGVAAGELVLLGTIVGNVSFAGEMLGALLTTVLLFGALGAGVAALLTRRASHSMSALEADLQQATQLMERRLINEQEYLDLKAKLIRDYRPARSQRRKVILLGGVWTSVASLTAVQLAMAMSVVWDPGGTLVAVIGATIGGVAVGGTSSLFLQRLRYRLERPALPAPPDRVRLDDPVLRDRPALEG